MSELTNERELQPAAPASEKHSVTAPRTLSHIDENGRFSAYQSCRLCPRACGVNRYEHAGFCRMPATLRVARAALHPWEEPCISGERGSGTVFFSGCTLRCCFCQNFRLSHKGFGKELSEEELSEVFLRLEEKGAENINLITPTHFLPGICRALDLCRHRLSIPVVLNCGGYESAETLRMLRGYIDVYLPDLKYQSNALSASCSAAPDYFVRTMEALSEMHAQTGIPNLSLPPDKTVLKRGLLIRHMVLPGHKEDSISLLRSLHAALPEHSYLLSLMSQYTPFYKAAEHPPLHRRLTSYEYGCVLREARALDFRGYLQERSSAKEEYTPPFNLEGL